MNQQISTLIKNLNSRNMKGYFVNTREDLFHLLEELIIAGSSVGCGDSVTLEETGVFDFLRNGNYIFYDTGQFIKDRIKVIILNENIGY